MNILDHIFPKQCIVCTKVGEYICEKCVKELKYTLPSCCVCNRLSNGYFTHPGCKDINIQCFTGWYMSRDIDTLFEKKKLLGIYSTHMYMLDILVKHLKLKDLISKSNVYPIYSKVRESYTLNRYMARRLDTGGKKENILFIGESMESVEDVLSQTRELHMKPLRIKILLLFKRITPDPQ